ncbi:MAG: imelysin family protein [Gracilimonas sp.]
MKKFAALIVTILLVWSCTDNGPSGPSPDDFDREAILVNWADNIILPSLQYFSNSTDSLQSAGAAFAENPNQQTLDNFREAWKKSYLAWQHVSVFQMDEDNQFQFTNSINNYPLCTAELNQSLPDDAQPDDKCKPEIKSYIEDGKYNLELPEQFDVQGLPALDYLLNGLGETNTEILAFYTSHNQSEAYQSYVLVLVNRIHSLAEEVKEYWETGYRDQFVNNSGNGLNASLDMMVNDYIYNYEKHLRAGKIGIPSGVFSGNPLSNRVEAYYSDGLSKALFMEALDATQNFFNGKHFNSTQTGQSLDDYLDYLNTMKNGTDLTELINNQFEIARQEAEGLEDDFASQVETNNSLMLSTYDKLQRNVVNLKVDMFQALNINVDYVDADGD